MSWQERAEQAERQSYEAATTLLPIPDDQPLNDDKTYLVPKVGESVWDVALKVGLKVPELMEHNGLDTKDPDAYNLAGGTLLHLSYPRGKGRVDERYHYDIWESPKKYYINNSEGSKKYAFENAKDWTDIKPVGGTNPQYKVVDIAGVVTITFSEDRIYSYYLDTLAVKDGKVKDTIGYPKEYLMEGESPAPPEQNPNMEEITALLESIEAPGEAVGTQDDLEADLEEATIVEPTRASQVVSPKNRINDGWVLDKTSYAELPDGPSKMRTIFACEVPDYSTRAIVREHFYGNVTIAGTYFLVKGRERIEVGRPQDAVDKGMWPGIDWDNLEDLYPITPEIQAEEDARDGMKLEVTPVEAKRLKIYEDALFRPVAKVAAHGAKAIENAKTKLRKVI